MLISKFYKIVFAGVATVAFLSGCGGGGGGAQGSGSAGGTSGGTVTITVTDSAGAATSNVNSLAHANATAVVKDAAGNVLKNVLVAFTTDSTYISFAPSTGTASTGSTGTSATVAMTPATGTYGGAVMLSAVATLSDGTQLTSDSVTLTVTPSAGGTGTSAASTLTLSVTTSGGTPSLSVTAPNSLKINGVVKDATGAVQKNVLVTFITDPNYLVFTPSSGTASTGSAGTSATVSMTPAATTPGGAVQVTAVATLSSGAQVNATPVTISVTGLPANATSTPSLVLSTTGTTLTVGSPLTVNITLKDGADAGLPNTVVTLSSSDPSLGVVSPLSVLTNSSGVATATLSAASINASGAAYVNASATVGSQTITASTPFQVGAASVAMTLTVTPLSISAFGTASVTANVTVNGVAPSSPMTVQFTSGCVSTGKASLPATATTVNGQASATYTDKGCGQIDTIVATIGAVQRTQQITVAAPSASNIQFVSTNPASGLLVLKGTGGQGYSETATVVFKVTDSSGSPMPQQSVVMGLTTTLGGITIDGGTASVTKLTGQDGTVSVSVQSGTAPTSVWVTAALGSNPAIATQSNRLIISTGRPSQDFFSLAASTFNIEGALIDGTSTTLTVHASDRLGNIVPDGTAINFIAEGGQIVSISGTATSTCMTSGGTCSVKLVSAEYRPQNDSEPSGKVTKDRVTVMAYTLGEESFLDSNGDNYYQLGEHFDDLGDIFLDNNENHVWDGGEQVIKYSASNTSACVDDMSTFMGTPNKLDWAASKPNTCDGVWGPAHVRRSLVIVFSGPHTQTVDVGPISVPVSCNGYYDVHLSDENNNPLPAGTKVEIVSNQVYSGSSQENVSVYPTTVPNTSAAGPTKHQVVFSISPSSCAGGAAGTFGLLVTTPSGVQSLFTYTAM